ncbi:putative pectin methyltransferase QUA2 [Acorus calamus]|uniref:Methyltransferase n=1 Tax=Acorus calamus TaxID=4465 RepID=A0AAV9DK17_ACOCL|nr:putative pectin methyltransferase QUA2 [Acorus calamus]
MMPRPLHRSLSIGGGEKGSPLKSPSRENGFGHGCGGGAQSIRGSRHAFIVRGLFPLVLFSVVVFAITWSVWWTVSISTASRANIYGGYRRLQEQLVSDLSQIGELSLGLVKTRELEFCPQDLENYVPCYNASSSTVEALDGGDPAAAVAAEEEYERRCTEYEKCLVPSPRNYRIPLHWPTGKEFIWKENVKITGNEFSSGSLTKRMMVEEEHISFRSDSLMVDGVEDYSHQIAEMIGLRNQSNFIEAGIRTVLDIGCGFGSFGAHLFSKELLTMCIANYEVSGSQVQITLERGLPAIIGSFTSKQLPFPYLSYDMVHCARCEISWEKKDGMLLSEVDRLLKPGGYFVWTSLTTTPRALRIKENKDNFLFITNFAENLCWELLSQQDETVVWKKTSRKDCYYSRKSGTSPPICSKGQDVESPYYQSLGFCIGGTRSRRWIPIEKRAHWPARAKLSMTDLDIYGVHTEDFSEDALNWNSILHNSYWSLLSPLIFSDHPKRPGDEDPSPPKNMLRNVLDMNAHFGGFNAALLEAGKEVWVMNVVPTSGTNYLPLILDRGFVGVQHDWCEAFPTYPRTYDMVHGEGILSLEARQKHRKCSFADILLEIDRILRPEGWVILRDRTPLIEAIRSVTTQLRWDARIVELENNNDERLLVCQKPFFKKQLK